MIVFAGAVLLPGQLAGGAAHRDHHPAFPAVRLRLHAFRRHPRQPAEPGRARLRHHRGRHAGDGGVHRAQPARTGRTGAGSLDVIKQAAVGDAAADLLLPADPDLPPTFRCSRWSASSGACSCPWPSPSAPRCWGRCLLPDAGAGAGDLLLPAGACKPWRNPLMHWLTRGYEAALRLPAEPPRQPSVGGGGRRSVRAFVWRAGSAPSSCRSSTRA